MMANPLCMGTPATATPQAAVNNRLQQLASTPANVDQVTPATTRQVSLSAVDCKQGSCFRPIVAAKVNLGDKEARYLVTYSQRNISNLVHILESLDQLSMEMKRKITIPLIKEVI